MIGWFRLAVSRCVTYMTNAAAAAGKIIKLSLSSCRKKVNAGGAAVLSCPAYFSDVQRDVMATAGGDAGLVVLDTIDEPVVSHQKFLSPTY